MAKSYKEAGVDIEAGDALVDWLQASDTSSKQPHQDKIVSGIGGFAALFRAKFDGMKSPLLVSSTDGVGTKVLLASQFGSYRGVGQDLVAMCVNDLICTGGQPLFFLDYYASGKLDLVAAKEFLAGVRSACAESDCALIGGETAEMPGVYKPGDFDCAGFAVGVVDEPKMLGAHRVRAGDKVIALASSGFHSNGYSLIRKVFADDAEKWRSTLLEPTRLYVQAVKALLKALGEDLHAACNVTGGGLDNLPRVLPEGLQVKLNAWKMPEPFLEVKRRTKTSWPDLLRTLNCGLGFVVYVDAAKAGAAIRACAEAGYQAFSIGEVGSGNREVWEIDTAGFEKQL